MSEARLLTSDFLHQSSFISHRSHALSENWLAANSDSTVLKEINVDVFFIDRVSDDIAPNDIFMNVCRYIRKYEILTSF